MWKKIITLRKSTHYINSTAYICRLLDLPISNFRFGLFLLIMSKCEKGWKLNKEADD